MLHIIEHTCWLFAHYMARNLDSTNVNDALMGSPDILLARRFRVERWDQYMRVCFALLSSIQVGMHHHCIYPIWMFYKWIYWNLYYEIMRKIKIAFESMKMMDKVCTIHGKLYYNIKHLWVYIMKRLQIYFHIDHWFSFSRGRLCILHVDGKSNLCRSKLHIDLVDT